MIIFRDEKDSSSWFDWEPPKKNGSMNNHCFPGNNYNKCDQLTSWHLPEIFSTCSAARTGGLDTGMYLTLLAARCADKLCTKSITLVTWSKPKFENRSPFASFLPGALNGWWTPQHTAVGHAQKR
jgi:hypothetical protein